MLKVIKKQKRWKLFWLMKQLVRNSFFRTLSITNGRLLQGMRGLVNTSNQELRIEKIASMQLDLTKHDYDVISVPGQYALERQPERQELRRGITEFF